MGENLIETGEVDPKGLTPKELHNAVVEKIRDTLKTNPNDKLLFNIDLAESTISSLNTFRSETIFNGQADSWDKNKLSPTPKTGNRQVRRKTKKAK